MNGQPFFATAAKGLERLLASELRELGATGPSPVPGGVRFSGDLATAYRACLWSRIANRVLLPLARLAVPDPEALYAGAAAIPWQEHLSPDGTLAVDCTGSAPWLRDTRFGALKVKDAIVDTLRQHCGRRPSVDTHRPDLRVNLHLRRGQATLAIDLSGDSLHLRGYRRSGALAPLKENLAAAILRLADWPAIAARGGALVDPMCGSGTLAIEAALMAGDIAPGLGRDYFGFLGWQGHRPELWAALRAEAEQRQARGMTRIPPIRGCDSDPAALEAARANAARAGLDDQVAFEHKPLADCRPPGTAPGLVVSNPPYGVRIGEKTELMGLYAELGQWLRRHFGGWQAAILTADADLGRRIGLRPAATHPLFNGPLQCRLLQFDIADRPPPAADRPSGNPPDPGAAMFANRLKKNLRHLGRWARREEVSCYRLYDADLPEYAVAVDLYPEADDGRLWAHVQEYAPPRRIDPAKARARLEGALGAVGEVLAIPPEQVVLKVRRRDKGGGQYGKLDRIGAAITVEEGGNRFLVNLTDYLDTGLFLDHRITRARVRDLAEGRDFLNLFAYTGTATVYAARGGARSTTTVDLSKTYLDWARRNLSLNGFSGEEHRFLHADCLDWLAREQGRYGLIFLDPPTFSNSQRMRDSFDIQRDHVTLIRAAANLLAKDGILLFSTNRRDFKLDRAALAGLAIEDLSRATLPKDFERNPRIHHCWQLCRGTGA